MKTSAIALSVVVIVAGLGACSSDAPKPASEPSGAAKPGEKPEAKPEAKPDAEAPADTKPAGGEDAPTAAARTWTFDDAAPGAPAPGIRLGETASTGTPATWAVVARDDAPSPPHAFGITKTVNAGQTYNVALVEGTNVADLDLTVMVHAVEGKEDRGGGFAFRASDADNYYIARWNPIETNVAFYVVQKGVRKALGKVPVEADPAEWHELRLVAQGPRFQLFLDDEPVQQIEDTTITGPGMIGLWTKADAATLFDDLSLGEP
jgi:hypothetical protein